MKQETSKLEANNLSNQQSELIATNEALFGKLLKTIKTLGSGMIVSEV